MYLRLTDYQRPDTLKGCLQAIAAGARPLGGGTHLNVRGHEHVERLVDLQSLPLDDVEATRGCLRLGGGLRLQRLARTDLPAGHEAIAEAVRAEANVAIRNQSTLGGRLARDASTGRLATALVALGANVELLSLSNGEVATETVALEAYVARDAAARRRQLIAAAVLPGTAVFSTYRSAGLSAMSAPYTDAAFAAFADGTCLVASGGHAGDASGTRALPETATYLASLDPKSPADDWRRALAEVAAKEVPEFTDAFAGGAYRRSVAITLITRSVASWLDAQGG